MKVYNTSNGLNADFYPEAVGKLNNVDPDALPGVALSVDDLGYIKQGSPASAGSGFEPTQAQLEAMNSGITSEDVEQINTNKNNISSLNVYGGGRNIADMSLSTYTTKTIDTVTVTLSGDTITINGTVPNVSNAFFNVYFVDANTKLIPTGSYIATLHGSGSENIVIQVGVPSLLDSGSVSPYAFTIQSDVTVSYMRILLPANAVYNNVSCKLMIRHSNDTMTEYQPYAMSNAEITAWIQAHT